MVNKALLVIDVQNYYINNLTKGLPKKIGDFINKSSYDFVLFAQFINTEDSNISKKLGWKKMMNSPDIDIVPELKKFAQHIFQKNSYSIFKNKEFVKFLRKNKIEAIDLCGIDTSACILAAAYDAFDLGYSLHVIEDLTESYKNKESKRAAMEFIKRNLEKR